MTTTVARVTSAVALRPHAGESESGDVSLVQGFDTGVLAAVIDGLGHGHDAAVAARAAAQVLQRHGTEPLDALLQRCHKQLVGTRGAVLSVAYLDGAKDSMVWSGVGNVCGVLFPRGPGPGRPRFALLAPGGIIGSALPRLQTQTYPVVPGALLIFASDGIAEGFAETVPPDVAPQQLADRILAHHAKDSDDALVLVMRYEGHEE